eukprot:1358833-Alexandrium_andersonii.AAC.1
MSASLVGSEMCIRDRNICGAVRNLIASACKGNSRALRLYRHLNGGAGPVSYTHLTLPTICSV